jgi:hypothetical protein
MTPMSPHRVHEDLDGSGPACVDHVNSREVEHDQLLAREQVGNTVYGRPRRRCERPAEGRDAPVGLAMEVDHERCDRRFRSG